jgi:hypothetical protein
MEKLLLCRGMSLIRCVLYTAFLVPSPFPLPPAGLSDRAAGEELALRLLRPGALLAALALYRSLYCLGTLHAQLQQAAQDPALAERRRWAWT